MNSTVETSAALAPATARFDRQHAGARQQRWMAELEQAMLAQQPGQRPIDTAQQPVPEAAEAAASTAPAAARPAAQAAVQGPQAAPAAASRSDGTAGKQATTGTAATHGHAADTATGELAARHGPGVAVGTPGAQDGAEPALAGAAGAIVPTMLATGPMPSAAPVAAILAAGGAEPAAPSGTAGVALARAGLGLAFGLANAAPQAESMPEAPMQAGAGADEAAPGEEYSRNLLHLFHGEDGVQAYIRDAELTGAQMRAVAQALAAELGGSGTRLAALTINGRRLPLGAASAYEQYEEEGSALAQAAPAARRSSIEQKGAI
ncbi:hypothetical protein [Pseudoduganella chitinolytica]|uniref:Uncharacterized protein n=1 Tax=Pseudoduganella chitinolytica TaxID=34070 RepID=A0ABY8BCF7_9BURK|nr:hypothetical protein [Pseudoduganella chitinolytica]WEF32853.1 hypothetical protein PX653_26230 [Pseudoduganella chitinolytica]